PRTIHIRSALDSPSKRLWESLPLSPRFQALIKGMPAEGIQGTEMECGFCWPRCPCAGHLPLRRGFVENPRAEDRAIAGQTMSTFRTGRLRGLWLQAYNQRHFDDTFVLTESSSLAGEGRVKAPRHRPMPDKGSISRWLGQLQDGDSLAVQ